MIHQMTVPSHCLITIADTMVTSHITIIQSQDTPTLTPPSAIQHTAIHLAPQIAHKQAQYQLSHSYQNHTETSTKMQIQMRHPRSN